jgi:hypothetical protein
MFVVCPSCSRHVRAEAAHCPFCTQPNATQSAPSRSMLPLVALAMVASMSTAACYGGPRGPGSPRPEVEPSSTGSSVAAPDAGAKTDK